MPNMQGLCPYYLKDHMKAMLYWQICGFIFQIWAQWIDSKNNWLTLTYLGYFASLNSWGGGGHYGPPPKISTMDGLINLKIGTDTE